MNKRVFLYVYGDDYSALHFEQEYNKQEIYERMANGGVVFGTIETDEGDIRIEIKEFGEIDDNFIKFVKDKVCDCDDLKHVNIFEVKPIGQ